MAHSVDSLLENLKRVVCIGETDYVRSFVVCSNSIACRAVLAEQLSLLSESCTAVMNAIFTAMCTLCNVFQLLPVPGTND